MRHRVEALAASLWLLAACRGVPVKMMTPEPLKVDITLRVDITQQRTAAATDTQTPVDDAQTAAPAESAGTSDEQTRRRDRMGRIQELKNSRLVGEARTGLLRIMRLPPGDYGRTVEELVTEENADRTGLMRAEAEARRVSLATVEAEQAAQWRQRAFPGEWVEERQPDGTWRWAQRAQAADAPRLSSEMPPVADEAPAP